MAGPDLYVDCWPPPTEAIIDGARNALAQGFTPEHGMAVTLTSLEPPSAVLAAQAALGLLDGGLTIEVQSVPSPDPRLPRRDDGLALWSYDEVAPAVPAPEQPVLDALAGVAAEPYTLDGYRAAAAALAGDGLKAREQDVLHALVHPLLPGPDGLDAWDWIARWQIAGALVLARSADGLALLERVALGPVDWVAAAAIIAWADAARSGNLQQRLALALTLLSSLSKDGGDRELTRPTMRGALWLVEPGSTLEKELQTIRDAL